MRTVLITFSFMEGNDDWGIPRINRIQNFLRYYIPLQNKGLNFEKIILIDNGSSPEHCEEIAKEFPSVDFITLPYLKRGIGKDCLPCWRCIYEYKKGIDQGFDKLLIIDDDAFLLSKRIMDYVNRIQSGWETFWCPKYRFPEGGISIICRDAFPSYLDFTKGTYESRNHSGWAELMFPYTKVTANFHCDRWGENHVPQQPDMDGYFQCPGDLILKPTGFEESL